MAAIADYIECEDCGFVVLSESDTEPEPKRVDACPNCGGDEFRFSSR